jgi:hypothetical protein
VTLGAQARAKPLRIRHRVGQPEFKAAWWDLSEHQRGGGLEPGTEQPGVTSRFQAKRPPVPVVRANLGQFHGASGLVD